ncbi:MAG: hypothetical protein Q9166_006297 [cf. Caloplaca sp. 2 TL-2023]
MVLSDPTLRLDPPRLPFYGIPYQRNPQFFGRRAELEQIRTAFVRGSEPTGQLTVSGAGSSLTSESTSSRDEAAPYPKSISICGIGGIGKTQLALEYASLYRSQYDAILWFNCGHQTSLTDSFIQTAANLFPTSRSRESLPCQGIVLQWLQSTGKSRFE